MHTEELPFLHQLPPSPYDASSLNADIYLLVLFSFENSDYNRLSTLCSSFFLFLFLLLIFFLFLKKFLNTREAPMPIHAADCKSFSLRSDGVDKTGFDWANVFFQIPILDVITDCCFTDVMIEGYSINAFTIFKLLLNGS